MKTKLHKNIMRRVYYSYAVSFASESALWQGLVLGACVALFGRLTHVAAIARNLEATSVQNAPGFIWHAFGNAFAGGEVLTGLVALFMIGLTASFFYRALGILTSSRSTQSAY